MARTGIRDGKCLGMVEMRASKGRIEWMLVLGRPKELLLKSKADL